MAAPQIQDQASSVQRELAASLQQSEFAKTLLADELDTTKHKLEEIRAQLQLAEQVRPAAPVSDPPGHTALRPLPERRPTPSAGA